MRFVRYGVLLSAAALLLDGCSSPSYTSVPSTVPPSVVSQQPAGTASLTTGIASTITLPAAAGVSGTLGLNAASAFPGGTTVTSVVTNIPPLSLPPLSHARRAEAVVPSQVSTYVTLLFSNTVVLQAPPTFTLAIPAAQVIAGSSYYIAFYDPLRPSLGWQDAFEGPVPAATSMTFTGSGTLTLAAGVVYGFGLYNAAAGTAAPTPAPAIAALPVPGALTTTVSSLAFGGTGTQNNQSFTIADSVATTAITETDSCTGIVTLTGGALAANARTFVASPLAQGTCSATFSDSNGANLGIAITVNVTNIGVQTKERN